MGFGGIFPPPPPSPSGGRGGQEGGRCASLPACQPAKPASLPSPPACPACPALPACQHASLPPCHLAIILILKGRGRRLRQLVRWQAGKLAGCQPACLPPQAGHLRRPLTATCLVLHGSSYIRLLCKNGNSSRGIYSCIRLFRMSLQ